MRCREITPQYAAEVWSMPTDEASKVLGMTALQLVTMADAPFNAILLALPLEALSLLETGSADEHELGMLRVPEAVWAAYYDLTYGIDVDEFLELPKGERQDYLEHWSEFPFSILARLTPYQLNFYYEHLAGGCDRTVAFAKASLAPADRPAEQPITGTRIRT